jgi:alanine racemase
MESEGIDALGVAYIEEAMELRRHGLACPILVFGGLPQEQIELYLAHDVDITASSVTKLEQIEEAAKRMGKRARAHLKIDTGFERIGVHYSAQTLFDAALKVEHVDIVGVYSHFADVNADDMTLTNLQLERFLEALSYYEARATQPFVRHIASSAGLMVSKATHLDMVRPGLALYGIYPGRGYEGIVSLKPALSLKSQVVYFKVVRKGAGVSYGHTWHAPEDPRVITVPIVGVICMDQLMVNIGKGEAYNSDEVVLIGKQGDSVVTVEELSALIETTPHQILVSLNERIPRIYVDSEGQ